MPHRVPNPFDRALEAFETATIFITVVRRPLLAAAYNKERQQEPRGEIIENFVFLEAPSMFDILLSQ